LCAQPSKENLSAKIDFIKFLTGTLTAVSTKLLAANPINRATAGRLDQIVRTADDNVSDGHWARIGPLYEPFAPKLQLAVMHLNSDIIAGLKSVPDFDNYFALIAAGKQEMYKLANQFEGAVGQIIETVSSASTELEASASTLTATAAGSQKLTTVVAAASEEASTNVRSVASATEELSSSINEISRQVQDSARMASEAVGQARATTVEVGELSKAASRIGDVVELINTIAGQPAGAERDHRGGTRR
jgi:hypothetical protein